MSKPVVSSASGLGAAVLGSLCCGGPIAITAVGVSAGAASLFEPLRPVLGLLMVGAFVLAFRSAYGSSTAVPAAADGTGGAPRSCPAPRSRTRERLVVWTSVVAAAFLWLYPTWSPLLTRGGR